MIAERIEAVREAADRRCELLAIQYVGAGQASGWETEPAEERQERELAELLAMLDPRWDAISRKPPAKIRQSNVWRTARAVPGGLLLISATEADLFGITPASPAAKRFVRLLAASGDPVELRRETNALPEQAVLAYGTWLAQAADRERGVRVWLASPNGEFEQAELTGERVQAACAHISQVDESSERIAITGVLTHWDAAKRSYRIESEGAEFAGRADRKLKSLLQELEASGKQPPLRAEAVIERRTAVRPITGSRITADWLMELDTDIGADPSETLYALEDVARRIRTLLESDDAGFGGLGLTEDEFAQYAAQLAELRAGNPLKGALRYLDRQDASQAAELMSEGRAIARWIECLNSSAAALDDMDTAPAARSKIAGRLSRAAAAAYPDLVALRLRLERMATSMRQALEKL
ncbi:hypothetical protein [Paenibacillus methanolicus]|uniref:Uncharacterized protein n=1 Tax=Paenibacillus methanolicus TaxID=582686 RepID=A0A5S5BZ16_9BACL|nr:hypothetical protein [Paenibacillus methanolicus]TYP72435.1 hypothetical protein BCM02_10889 [Paenibacillus methanolicus]